MINAKSFVLPAAFPSSRTGIGGLSRALDLLAPRGLSAVEYYCVLGENGLSAGRVAALMAGRQTVFLAGARQKAEGLNPCSPDRDVREKAVAGLGECFRFARQAGASAVMLSSGARPADEGDDNECFSLLADSLGRLHRLEPDLPILLEPGDRDVEYRHLVGPTARAAEFTAARRKDGIPLGLIFDMSHAAQLGETLEAAWNQAEPFCGHVHFANCILDKNSPLYGDKHPFFEVPGGVYTHRDAREFLALLQKSPKAFTVSLEMICPPGEDEGRFFDRLTRAHPWFFEPQTAVSA